MRTLDAALTSAQQAASREPYLRIYFDDRDGTTHTYTTRDGTNRIFYVEQWEEGWAGAATIWLKNHDQGLSAADYRGYSVSIGWGMVLDDTPGSTWYSNAAVMKVLKQRDISYQGELITEFYCVSKWYEIMHSSVLAAGKKLTGTLVGANDFVIGETVTGDSSSATGIVVSYGNDGTNDFIIVIRVSGTFTSGEDVDGASASLDNIGSPVDNYGPMVYRSGDTNTEARIESITGLTVDVDEDDPDGSMADTPKLEVPIGISNRAVIRKMMLRTKCGLRFENDGKLHALYLDTSDAAQYEFQSTHAFFEGLRDRAIIVPNTVVFIDKLPDKEGNAATYIGTANDATSVSAIGTLTTIQVDPDIASDAEGNTRSAAWIAQMVAQAYQGKITAPMECGLEVYDMVQCVDTRLNVTTKGRIGRWERYYHPARDRYEFVATLGSVYSEPGAMGGPTDMDSDLQDLTDNLDRTPPVVRQSVYPWQLWQSVQPYTVDILIEPVTDKNHIKWGSGTIYFKDGTTLSIDADASEDISAGAGWLYFTEGSATLTYTQTYSDCVAPTHGLVAFVAPGTEAGLTALIVPFAGKTPALNADIITCIYLSALAANMGTLNAGTINLDGGDLIFYYSSAASGHIYGVAGGLGLLGKPDVWIYTSEDGGGGGVSINAGSLPTTPTLDDTRLEADADVFIQATDDLWLQSGDELDILAGDHIAIGSGGLTPAPALDDIIISANSDLKLYGIDSIELVDDAITDDLDAASTLKDIGSTARYDDVYADEFYANTGYNDHLDDIALLLQMKSKPDDHTKLDTRTLPDVLKFDHDKYIAKRIAKLDMKDEELHQRITDSQDMIALQSTGLYDRLEQYRNEAEGLEDNESPPLVRRSIALKLAVIVIGKKLDKLSTLHERLGSKLSGIGLDRQAKIEFWERRFVEVSRESVPQSKLLSLAVGAIRQMATKLEQVEQRIAQLEVR